LENFKKFVQKEKNITLQYDKSVIYLLAEKWRDPDYGVRPLKRAIQKWIVDELALYILEHNIEEDTILMIAVIQWWIIITQR
jgi:ATP-dependent Clp protease ATP-binding subunit ClpB